MPKKYIIIGASAAGISAANKLRQLDPQSSILCLSQEHETPYNKCFLADWLAGIKTEQDIWILTQELAQKKNIELKLGITIQHIDHENKVVVGNEGVSYPYDALLIATGTRPAKISLEIPNVTNFFTFHYSADVTAIKDYCVHNKVQHAVIIGAGLTGLECADALVLQSISVTIIEKNPHILSSISSRDGSEFIKKQILKHGVTIYTSATIKTFVYNTTKIEAVVLHDDTIIKTDVVINAIGLRPNLDLIKNAAINYSDTGITTNEYMATSVPSIYAVGDCAVVYDQLFDTYVPNRTWPDAMFQGIIAAHAMAGVPKKYPGLSAVVSSSFFGIKCARCGPIDPQTSEQEKIIIQTEEYHHEFLWERGYLKGFLLPGNTEKVSEFRKAILTKTFVTRDSLY